MRRLTEEQITNINSSIIDSWNQGVFVEPYGISTAEKLPVIYQRYKTGGVTGGSCWERNMRNYKNDEPRPNWEALDKVLTELCPNITYLQYKAIEQLVINANESDEDYYGNREEYDIWYLPLETLYEHLGI